PEWQRLQEEAGQLPFTDYFFFDGWGEHIAKPAGRRLHIATAHLDGRLVAIWPLTVVHKKGFRILQPAGKETGFPCEFLSQSPLYAGALVELVRHSPHYDFAMLRHVDVESPLSSALRV